MNALKETPATMDEKTGLILHLQRLSTEDGPGIRTTVFMKGCPLHCAWCHNPESIAPHAQVQWLENRCIGCLTCVAVCPNHALAWKDQEIRIDRELCQGCGTCTAECPTNALELLGKRVSAADLSRELLKDRSFYRTSNGGVTLSGGEPTLQPDFTRELLATLRQAGIHTALDTCGLCSRETLLDLLPLTDLVLFDIKAVHPDLHRKYTRQENRRILENFETVLAYQRVHPSLSLWVRTPVIPESTATAENIREIGAYLKGVDAGAVERWELCAFNNLCRDKYRRLGMDWDYRETPLMTRAELADVEDWAKNSGFDPARIFVTGAARVENSN